MRPRNLRRGLSERAMAEECFRWAQQAQTEDKRQAYLDVPGRG